MTLAVQIPYSTNEEAWQHSFTYLLFVAWAKLHPTSHVVFIFNEEPIGYNLTDSNIQKICLPPTTTNNILKHFWYQYKLPRVLVKQNATHFISASPFCSLHSTVSEMLYVDMKDLEGKQDAYKKRYFPKCIRFAKHIMVPNLTVEQVLISKFPFATGKTLVLPFGYLHAPIELHNDTSEQIKLQYSEGSDYFLYDARPGNKPDCITVLKAFSQFKKWQKSSMKLLIVASKEQQQEIEKALKTYKYRDALTLLVPKNNLETGMLSRSAYASIMFPDKKQYLPEAIFSISWGAALLLPDEAYFRDAFKDAVHYFTPNEKNLAQALMLLYKDESIRGNLIVAAANQIKQQTWFKTAESFHEVILPTSQRETHKFAEK